MKRSIFFQSILLTIIVIVCTILPNNNNNLIVHAKKRSKKKKNALNHFSLQLKVKSTQIEDTLNGAKKLLEYGKKEKIAEPLLISLRAAASSGWNAGMLECWNAGKK